MNRIGLTLCALVTLLGCASHGGWAEGARVNDEVRRVLVSEDAGPMGISANGVLYLVPPDALEAERGAFLRALAEAEAARTWPFVLSELPARPPKSLPPRPPYDESIHALRAPEVVEIRYPDCTCRVQRLDTGDGGVSFSVDLIDRRADIDRGWVYHMGLLPSPAIDAAWGVLLDAVARDVAYDHVGAVRGSPLLALRKAGVDRGWIKSGN
jgi:hypothetical protein